MYNYNIKELNRRLYKVCNGSNIVYNNGSNSGSPPANSMKNIEK